MVLEIKPAEGVTSLKTQFLEGLRIDDMPVTEIEMDDEGQNSNGGNVLFKLGEDDETVMAAYLFLDNTKTSWTIHSDVLLSGEPRLMTSSPDVYERLKDVSFDGTTLHAAAANLEEDVRYELHTYMGREPGSAEYTVDTEEAVTEIPTGSDHYDYTVNVPTEGMHAESGDYYVSTALLKIIRDDFNGDGTISKDEVAQVALDRWESDSTFYYRNTNVPDAPQNAGIEAGGNETLTCTFGEVGNADGYRLRIYKDGKDTGYGYDFPVLKGTDPETGDAIDTLDGTGSKEAVTHKDGVYTVCVAPTVGGQQMADDADDLAEILQPGSGYMLGVSAYRYVDQEEKQYPLYSEETLSNEAEILPYQE